LFSFRIEL
ncbi:hypothetical protein D043_3019B, partial [Vibrio parahaemolyticus EKP-021]